MNPAMIGGHTRTYGDLVMTMLPVAYWRLGEASGTVAVDQMGAYHGTYVNAPTLGAAGALTGDTDTAATFTAAGSHRMTSGVGIGQTGWTLAGWVSAGANSGKPLFGRWAVNNGAMVYANGAVAGTGVSVYNGAVSVASVGGVLTGAAHFIVGTWDGVRVRLYVDGVENNSAASVAAPGTGGVHFVSYSTGVAAYATATYDEHAIWDRALTAAEIAALYAAGTVAPSVTIGADAHPYNLEINGTDLIASMLSDSLSIEMPGPGSNGSMMFRLLDPTSAITISEWDEVKFIEHAATRPILFGGFVQSIRYIADIGTRRWVEVRVVGYGILLDRKVVVSQAIGDWLRNWSMSDVIVTMVNRWGGIVKALSILDATLGLTDGTYGLYENQPWSWFVVGAAPVVPAPSTLRAALDYVLGTGNDYAYVRGKFAIRPTSSSYWVDSAAMMRAFPDVPDGWDPYDDSYFFDGSSPGLALDDVGTYQVTDIAYEREDTDRLTSAYVSGGAAPGTGYYRSAPMSRAGDLEGIVTDATSTAADDIVSFGGPAVSATASATARGTAVVVSATPLDIWPGRHISIDVARVGLTAAMPWRVTGVEITFQTTTQRTYRIDFGGSVPAPSAMRRSGRFATI